MKKWISYGACVAVLGGSAALMMFAPELLSRVIVGLMTGILIMGIVFGVVPLIQYSSGFERALRTVQRLQETKTSMPWIVISQSEEFFSEKLLDRLFEDYKEKVNQERKNGMIIGGIDEAINEDELALRCWQGVMIQIPGTLTGLGLLGTFIGLITGIRGIEVSSLDAALTSIEVLFDGIQLAFYTSIAGVILSILFNIMYKLLWNIMIRDMEMFIRTFERNVIPPVEEQERYFQKKDMEQIQERLSRLPHMGSFSLASGGAGMPGGAGNESVLMPQILAGLQRKEFVFHLQPRYDLNTQTIVGAEALVRWNHPKLGLVAPSVFIPVLEKNGYITKLDQYIWDMVCEKMREWIDAGIRPIPISVNISKTDILALDVLDIYTDLMKKYRIPPRYLEFDIAQNAYMEAQEVTYDFEKKMQQKGFRIVVDGFQGDYFALNAGEHASRADAYKLDLRFCKDNKIVASIAEKARNMHIVMIAEGIENMEQMAVLRKNGITEGQGYYLSKPVAAGEFEKMMKWRQDV